MPFSVEAIVGLPIVWKHTGDAEFPYTAEVSGRCFTIRINDFPAEPLYTLLVDGNELADLEDWPSAWEMPSPPEDSSRSSSRRRSRALRPRRHGRSCTVSRASWRSVG